MENPTGFGPVRLKVVMVHISPNCHERCGSAVQHGSATHLFSGHPWVLCPASSGGHPLRGSAQWRQSWEATLLLLSGHLPEKEGQKKPWRPWNSFAAELRRTTEVQFVSISSPNIYRGSALSVIEPSPLEEEGKCIMPLIP